jgi:hypothetical protein
MGYDTLVPYEVITWRQSAVSWLASHFVAASGCSSRDDAAAHHIDGIDKRWHNLFKNLAAVHLPYTVTNKGQRLPNGLTPSEMHTKMTP